MASTSSRRPRCPGAEFTGFKLDFGAAFTSQVQNLTHANTAVPVMVSGVNTNQLADIGFGFNNSDRQPLSQRAARARHPRRDDQLPVVASPQRDVGQGRLHPDRRVADRLRAAQDAVADRHACASVHMEINYGDAHFRRSDNGNALYNPFVGNYIMDAFTTEIGGEVYLKTGASSRWGRSPAARSAARC